MSLAPAALSDEEFAAWFRLLETPGIGRGTARVALAALGSPQAVLAASASELKALLGARAANALASIPPNWTERLAAAQTWRHGGAERHCLVLGDPAYPAALLQTADPPLMLYALGDLAVLERPSLAIVGSRNPSPQGEDNARSFARHLSASGWLVVSGLALGVDAAAHEGALDALDGGASGDSGVERTRSELGAGTLAVVGTGLDRVYPSRHRALAQRIAETGLLLSEYAPGTPPLPPHFPLRNRIIAGLTRGTLVVEAALQSGSLITARLASEAGRDVFAIPGSIHAPQSRGCHALIKQGAQLVEAAQDILDALAWPAVATGAAASGAAEGVEDTAGYTDDALSIDAASKGASSGLGHRDDPALLRALGQDPVTLDHLIDRTGLSGPQLQLRLLELELAGRVSRLPGGQFQRRRQG